jgi:hypothetical protein
VPFVSVYQKPFRIAQDLTIDAAPDAQTALYESSATVLK